MTYNYELHTTTVDNNIIIIFNYKYFQFNKPI